MRSKLLGVIITALSTLLLNSCDSNETPNNTKKTLEIGAILPLTGSASFLGESIKNGIKLSEEKNSTLIKIIYDDCQADPQKAISSYLKMKSNGIKVIIPTFSSVTSAIAPLSKDSNELLFATSVSAFGITNKSNNLFRLFVHADGDADLIADFAIDTLKIKNVGILYINDEFGKDYLNVFKSQILKREGNVIAELPFDKTEMDFKNITLKAKSLTQCDAFYVVGYDKNLIQLLKSYHASKVKKPILSIATIGQQNVKNELEKIFQELPPVYYTATAFTTNRIKSQEKDAFVKTYTKRFGKEPDYFAAFSYDLTNILAESISKEPNNIKKYISETDFKCVMGNITFSPNRDANFKMFIERLNK